MTSRLTACLVATILAATGASLSADRIRLRSGKVVEGMFIGADSKAVRLLLENGQIFEAAIEDATVVEFAARKPAPKPAPAKAPAPAPAAPRPAAAAAPAPAAAARAVTVPAGSMINVRLSQAINVDASQAGMKFKGVVDDPVLVDGAIAIPRGASAVLQAVQVQQSGKMKGADKISLKLNAVGFGGMMHEVTTDYVEQKGGGEGKKTARKVGGGAGLGAIIGGIAGGGSGAAIGAAVGGATGAAVASGGEEHLELPAETRLQFRVSGAVTIRQ